MSEDLIIPEASFPLTERGLTDFAILLARKGVISGPGFLDWARRIGPVINRSSRESSSARGSRRGGQPGGKSSKATPSKTSSKKPAGASKNEGKKSEGSKPSDKKPVETKNQKADNRTMSGMRKLVKYFVSNGAQFLEINTIDQHSWQDLKKDPALCVLIEQFLTAEFGTRLGIKKGFEEPSDVRLRALKKETMSDIFKEANLTKEEIDTSRRYYPKFVHLALKKEKPKSDDETSLAENYSDQEDVSPSPTRRKDVAESKQESA